ncbi:hypothetical protein [Gluconobacter japonicus]|uniref:Uncharacterized protein n=1 Tax=Gluconobacter japonicus TaxID=376620 RepID=A0A9Q2FIW7_GLUJA|nr:hypothetical protein [Gluconobacter japonicus]MBF0869934.1 hypothetical protein [Gluconobacter japonicus]
MHSYKKLCIEALTVQTVSSSEEQMLVTYDPNEPIELKKFSDSIGALADEYHSYIRKNYKFSPDNFPEIRIREIRKGSIIVDLFNSVISGGFFDDADKINHGLEFFKNIKGLTSFFLGKSKEPPKNTTTSTVKNLIDMVEPISQDVGGNMIFHASGNGTINININQSEANLISRRGENWIAQQKIPTKKTYTKEIFYWYQTRDTFSNKTGDKGIVESIIKRPVNTYISNEEIKSKMIEGEFFNKYYLVDLVVDDIEEKPSLYRIINLIKIYDK